MKKILIASTSTIHGTDYLEYLLNVLEVHFKKADTVLFIPYACPGGISHQDYTKTVKTAFSKINKNIKGIHEFDSPTEAIKSAQAIFTGGGNTFVLVNQLYKYNLISILKSKIESGTPYFGTSAGSNICGLTIGTSNDMPIVYPPSFNTLGLISFNINPHYLDPDPSSNHMGETRETRINEYHTINNTSVLGLREGSWLDVRGNKVVLKGKLHARLFQPKKQAVELPPETDLSFLM